MIAAWSHALVILMISSSIGAASLVRAQAVPPPSAAFQHVNLQLQATDSERAPNDPPPNIHPTRAHTALFTTGIWTLSASCDTTALFGLMMAGLSGLDDSDGAKIRAATTLLWIPLAGPWLAMTQYDRWTPIFAVFGASEALGLVLTLAGAYEYATGGRTRAPTMPTDRFTISAAPAPGGAQLALRIRL